MEPIEINPENIGKVFTRLSKLKPQFFTVSDEVLKRGFVYKGPLEWVPDKKLFIIKNEDIPLI